MSQENIELARRALKAFERRDLSEFEDICHPDIEFDWSRRLLDPVVVRGYEGMRGFFDEVTSLFEEAVFEEEEMIEFGNDVLVVSLARFRGRTSGAEVTARGAIIWTVRDGKLARFRFYQSKEDALEELQAFGLAFRAGDKRHHRAYIGPPGDYDLIGGLQFTLLFQAGLRETHRLLDLGCGSLRAGRLLIPYLRPGNYYGVEPNGWLVEEGIANELGAEILKVKRPTFSNIDDFSLGALGVKFDYVIAHSVLSHTFPDLASIVFSGVHDCLQDAGLLIATFLERGKPLPGSGWSYPANVPYAWSDMCALAEGAGLEIRRLSWPHPRQVWFLGARRQDALEEAAACIEQAERPLV